MRPRRCRTPDRRPACGHSPGAGPGCGHLDRPAGRRAAVCPALALSATLWHACLHAALAPRSPEADVGRHALLALVAGMGIVTALLPSLAGRAPGKPLVAVLPVLALAAPSLRLPRLGWSLAAVGVALSLWLLVAVRLDDPRVSPVQHRAVEHGRGRRPAA
jgi:hypothetical protein